MSKHTREMIAEVEKYHRCKPGDEAFDDLRLIIAGAVEHLGAATMHGRQALEAYEDQHMKISWAEWTSAREALLQACGRIDDAISNCVEAGAEEEPEDPVYPSCQAANDALGPCPRPLQGSDGCHWWYVDHEADERSARLGEEKDYIRCVCKSCPQTMRLSIDAEELPV